MISPDTIKELLERQSELSFLTANKEISRTAALKMAEFILFLTEESQPDFLSANFAEYEEIFLRAAEKFPVSGAAPEESDMLIRAIEKLIPVSGGDVSEKLTAELTRLRREHERLRAKLTGNYNDTALIYENRSFYFPVLEKRKDAGEGCYLDSVNVTLTPSANETKYFILSRYSDPAGVLLSQIKESFQFALAFSTEGMKLKKERFFNVHVKFSGDYGEYKGKSFGAALTLAFILEIKKALKPDTEFRIKHKITLTGEINSSGELIKTGEENITLKTRGVFYSDTDVFVIPFEDFPSVSAPLKQLSEKYPERKLVILPVKNVSEILTGDDLIEIKKKPPLKRAAGVINRHMPAAFFSLMIISAIIYLALTSDENPAGYRISGYAFNIINKSGNLLWSRDTEINLDYNKKDSDLRQMIRIFDANNDGFNEVLIAQIKPDTSTGIYRERCLVLFDHKGKMLWQFIFDDSVYSYREGYLENVYGTSIIEISEENGKKIIWLINNNTPSFASALIRIEASTGKRLKGSLWYPGHMIKGRVLNSGRKQELLIIAFNNAYQNLSAFIVPAETEEGQIPSTHAYLLRGLKLINPRLYVRFPMNDYELFNNFTFPVSSVTSLTEHRKNLIEIGTVNPENPEEGFLTLWLNIFTGEVSVFVNSRFRVLRDSLVAKGLLNPPFTDTKEYRDIYRDSIMYYVNGQWIKYREYHKLRERNPGG